MFGNDKSNLRFLSLPNQNFWQAPRLWSYSNDILCSRFQEVDQFNFYIFWLLPIYPCLHLISNIGSAIIDLWFLKYWSHNWIFARVAIPQCPMIAANWCLVYFATFINSFNSFPPEASCDVAINRVPTLGVVNCATIAAVCFIASRANSLVVTDGAKGVVGTDANSPNDALSWWFFHC